MGRRLLPAETVGDVYEYSSPCRSLTRRIESGVRVWGDTGRRPGDQEKCVAPFVLFCLQIFYQKKSQQVGARVRVPARATRLSAMSFDLACLGVAPPLFHSPFLSSFPLCMSFKLFRCGFLAHSEYFV